MNKRQIVQDLTKAGKTIPEIIKITGYHRSVVRYYRDSNFPKKNAICNAEHRRKVKRKALAYSGGKCLHCNYSQHDSALIFHHLDPSKKDVRIASGSSRSWDRIKNEVDKCLLLCHNCHSEYHGGFWKIDDDLINQQHKIRLNYKDQPLLAYADNPLEKTLKNVYRTKTRNAPSKDELLNLLLTMSTKAIGEKYECSTHVARNWCKQFNINIAPITKKPIKTILESLIKDLPATKIAIKYGVSDRTVGKWLKSYNIPNPHKHGRP